jgi:hypothetical protein
MNCSASLWELHSHESRNGAAPISSLHSIASALLIKAELYHELVHDPRHIFVQNVAVRSRVVSPDFARDLGFVRRKVAGESVAGVRRCDDIESWDGQRCGGSRMS